MPWQPQFPPVPPHPAQQFDFWVAEVLAPSDGPVGHLVVFAEPYARSTGRLWWKKMSDPHMTLEIWSVIQGEFDDPFYFLDEEMVAVVDGLQRGEWQHFRRDSAPTYVVRWLDGDESGRVAAEVFGLDLAAERRRRRQVD